jgi:FdhE protein
MILSATPKASVRVRRSSAVEYALEELASKYLPGRLADETRALHAELHQDPDAPPAPWLGCSFAHTCRGLLQYLSWAVLARYLHPIVKAFESWRNEERWLRNYCVSSEYRLRWPNWSGPIPAASDYSRAVVAVHIGAIGEPVAHSAKKKAITSHCAGGRRRRRAADRPLRACGDCLKTYNGEGSESVLLADWTSLHLDIVAPDRGLKRRALSLYEL